MNRSYTVIIALLLLSSASAYIIDPSSTGFGSANRSSNYNTLTEGWRTTGNGNVTWTGQLSTGPTVEIVPWFNRGDACLGYADANGLYNCQSGIGTLNMTNFCGVTDETSQVALSDAMGQNNTRMAYWVSMITALRCDRADHLTEWTYSLTKASNSTWTLGCSQASGNDSASDADAHFITALGVINNSAYANQTTRTAAGDYLALMCPDFVDNEFTTVNWTSRINPGEQITRSPRGGVNVGVATNAEYMYTGYNGPMLEALAACHKRMGDSTKNYTLYADQLVQSHLQASNWTGTTFTIGNGRNYHWSSTSGNAYSICDTSCTSQGYTDDPDGMRAPRICNGGYAWSLANVTLRNLTTYCQQWMNLAGETSTKHVIERYFDGSAKSSTSDGSYKAMGLGLFMNTIVNTSIASARLDQYNSHYSSGTFDSQSCMGVYDKAFGIMASGILMGYADAAWSTSNTTTSAPTINTARITPTTAYANDTLIGYCNASTSNGANVTYNWAWYLNGVVNSTGAIVPGMCYQETANQSSTCGGLGTGKYAYTESSTGVCSHAEYASDGNYTSYAQVIGSPSDVCTIYMNYTTPIFATIGSSWAKFSYIAAGYNGTFPIYTTQQFRARSAGSANVFWEYFNGSSWQNIETSGASNRIYEEAIYWNMTALPSGIEYVVSTKASISAGQNWTFSCQANDTQNTSSWLNSSTLTISDTAPNVTSANLTPLPSVAGQAINITSTCTDIDPSDTCNAITQYNWYKNGTSLSLNSSSLAPGNFTTGDNITGSIRVSDGTLWSSWRNTSTTQIGDNILPNITGFTLSAAIITNIDQVDIRANCTDNAAVNLVLVEITDPNAAKINYTMTLLSGNTYDFAYTPSPVGTYTAKIYCTDTNANTANTITSTFTVTATATVIIAAGGGGGAQNVMCGFSLVSPLSGYVNPICPSGSRSAGFSYTIKNDQNSPQTYMISQQDLDCTGGLGSFSVGANGNYAGTISNCTCPVNAEQTVGNIIITNGPCTQTIPVTLYENIIARALSDPATRLRILIITAVGLFTTLGLIIIKRG